MKKHVIRSGGKYKTTVYPHLKHTFDVYKRGPAKKGMLLSRKGVGRRRRRSKRRGRKGGSMKGFNDAMHVIGSIFGTASKLLPFGALL